MFYSKMNALLLTLIASGYAGAQDIPNLSFLSFTRSSEPEGARALLRSGVDVISRDPSKKTQGLRLRGNAKPKQHSIGIGPSSNGPTVELLDPANGDVVTASEHVFKFRVTESQGHSATLGSSFFITAPQGHPYTSMSDVFPHNTYLCDQNDPYGVWTVCSDAKNLVSGVWKWKVEAEDENGQTGVSEEAIFTVELGEGTCDSPCFEYQGHCICGQFTTATECSMTVDNQQCSCCEHNGEDITAVDCPIIGELGQCQGTPPPGTCESPCFEHQGHCICAQVTTATECSMTVDNQECSCCEHNGEDITAVDCPIIGKDGQCGGSGLGFPF